MNNPLFIGLGSSPPCWYRIALPANQLGKDWIGIYGNPANFGILAGNIENVNNSFDGYDTYICQQPKGVEWLNWIKKKQSEGCKVYFEVDDFLHGVNRIKDHSRKTAFNKKAIKEFVDCMKQADGMICSTEFLSKQYSKYNENQFVCKNGIDSDRYASVKFPERDKIVVGWIGGTGHHLAIGPWLEEISDVMANNKNVSFVSIGIRYADTLAVRHPGRALSVPWVSLENLPYALTHFDCYIAPFHDSKYFKSKSDLRWLEGSAVGIPGVLHPEIYTEVENGETGLLATNTKTFREQIETIISDDNYRQKLGKQSQEYVRVYRDIKQTHKEWLNILK